MNTDNALLTIAVIAVLISGIGVGFTYYTVTGFQAWLTGLVTDTATANVTISTTEAINFTTDNIDWGTGYIFSGYINATLRTDNIDNVGGNWTNISQGFVLENIGNINVSLNISTDKSAAQFIGGTAGGGPVYQYNVTNVEAGSCTNSTGFDLGTYYDVNYTSPGPSVCDVFEYLDGKDSIRIDIKVVIPNDAAGTKGSIMTATATPV